VLTLHDRVNLLRDVARALAYAHGEGVVHRDIKPENILLSAGTAVVTDFGIAKAISASRTHDGASPESPDGTLTQVGSSIGTPAYMAPEQAVGDVVDHRADLYAWGVVAYELFSGAHPFAGKAGPSQLIAALPLEVAALVMQCLAKNPSERPANANALLERLASVSTPSAERAASPMPAPRRRTAIIAGVALLTLVAGALWVARGRAPSDAADTNAAADAAAAATSNTTEPAGVISALAVLPFVNTSGNAEDEYFSDGLTDELITDLSRVKSLRVISRTTAMQYKGTTQSLRTIGDTLGVRWALTGSVRRAGNALRINAQLVDVQRDEPRWAEKYNGTLDDVFDVQERVSRAIVDALDVA